MRTHVLLAIGVWMVAAACSRRPTAASEPGTPAPTPTERTEAPGPVGASFRHVNLHVDDGIVLEIARLDGALVSTRPGAPPIFDDPHSFTVRIDSGEIAMSPESLSNLMNQHVFAYEGAPLKNLKLSIEDGHLKQHGTLHKGVNVPFSLIADVSLTTDGRIRLHPLSMKLLGIPSGGLMKVLGIDLDGIIKLRQASGVEIEGDDFLLAPERLLPAPTIAGRLTGVRVEGDRMIETFGPPKVATPLVPPDRAAPNFLYFRGGTLRFGRLTMSDADMELESDMRGPAFEFSLPHYLDQLVAGYSKNTANGGLIVHMPNYHTPVAETSPDRP